MRRLKSCIASACVETKDDKFLPAVAKRPARTYLRNTAPLAGAVFSFEQIQDVKTGA